VRSRHALAIIDAIIDAIGSAPLLSASTRFSGTRLLGIRYAAIGRPTSRSIIRSEETIRERHHSLSPSLSLSLRERRQRMEYSHSVRGDLHPLTSICARARHFSGRGPSCNIRILLSREREAARARLIARSRSVRRGALSVEISIRARAMQIVIQIASLVVANSQPANEAPINSTCRRAVAPLKAKNWPNRALAGARAAIALHAYQLSQGTPHGRRQEASGQSTEEVPAVERRVHWKRSSRDRVGENNYRSIYLLPRERVESHLNDIS